MNQYSSNALTYPISSLSSIHTKAPLMVRWSIRIYHHQKGWVKEQKSESLSSHLLHLHQIHVRLPWKIKKSRLDSVKNSWNNKCSVSKSSIFMFSWPLLWFLTLVSYMFICFYCFILWELHISAQDPSVPSGVCLLQAQLHTAECLVHFISQTSKM